jgi:hypothetical protein
VTGGGLNRSAISVSLSPCPVMTQTTRAPRGGRCRTSAASPAAEEGSQKSPSKRASSCQQARISSSERGTTAPSERATAFSTSARCAGSAIRIALAAVVRRPAASPARSVGSPAPASSNPRAYAQRFPPPP